MMNQPPPTMSYKPLPSTNYGSYQSVPSTNYGSYNQYHSTNYGSYHQGPPTNYGYQPPMMTNYNQMYSQAPSTGSYGYQGNRQASNTNMNYLYYMMADGQENALPMMALMNRGNRRGGPLNPFMMSMMFENIM